ncbi:MAG: T9SS type A sorting domain-containing protein [Bacteroidota bacterium]
MRILVKLLPLLTALFIYTTPLFSQTRPLFQEENGLLVIEAESASIPSEWSQQTALTPFTGENYLLYSGPNLFNTTGRALLEYEIIISTPGKYRFQWRSRIAIGDSNTEHNDSWLRFPDAADFYGQKGEELVYPKGVGKTPNPEGSTREGWFKIYQNVRDNWTWRANTSDRDPHNIFVEFDSAGTYLMQIAGRSNGHAIDRIALYHSTVAESFATNTLRPESINLNPVNSSVDLEVLPIQLRPNPASESLNVTIPKNFGSSLSNIMIFNTSGQLIKNSTQRVGASSTLNIPVNEFPSGVYWLQITNKQQILRSKFIKK